MRVAAAALAVAACKGDAPPPSPRVAIIDAAPAAAGLRPGMPGEIYYVDDRAPPALVRIRVDQATPLRLDGFLVFPSASKVGDRVVAIASRGTGEADGEQIVLVDRDGAMTRVGPTGVKVRDPAVTDHDTIVIAGLLGDGVNDLYRFEVASSPVLRLTGETAGSYYPAHLPGTDDLVFESSRDGDVEIYRMAVTGGTARRLTAFHKDDWHPTPSPDGKTVAFVSDREGAPRIFLMAPDGTGQRRLTAGADGPDEGTPVWSPDSRGLAYVRGTGVRLRDVAAGTERVLTPAGAKDAEPSFSPDGRWLAVSRDDAIWAIPLAGGEPVKLAGHGRLPRWHTAATSP